MKKTFNNQLKEKYKDLYNAVRPIPYLKDRQYCVNTIFVDGGIELRHDQVGVKSKWEKLNSYTDIFDSRRIEFTRLILEGEPGYGKSTIALQLAYDWCNQTQSSHLKDIHILILLRLRQLGGVSSIFTAIKKFLLPYDSELQEVDIKHILTNTESVAIIMDGYDEYPDQDKTSEIMKVFQRNMFQTFQVILTTRVSCVPVKFSPQTKRIRLTGFDDKAQENYIRKALAVTDDENVKKIKFRLQDNPVLSGLCQVPLFFAMYTHMTVESQVILNFNSVTSFFQHMVDCFHEHLKNKMDDDNVVESELFKNEHQKLDRIAFEALSGRVRPWMKNDLQKRLGKKFYEAYIRIGILVEEETSQLVQNPTSLPIEKKTEVRFYHKLFCEWYAAHFLSRYASKSLSFRLGNIVKKRNPFDLHYLYRFACGLNPSASGKIIKHIKKLKGGDKFAILCLMEKTGSIQDVKETIRQLCAEGIIISNDDSLLLQMSSLQLLEIAANNNIPITVVRLQNSLDSVDLSTISIRLKSHLTLSSRIPMEGLQISLTTREICEEITTDISEDEIIAVFEFSTKCPSLKALWYLGCTLPQRFESSPTLTALKSGNIKVFWRRLEDEPTYVLNVQSGSWELTHEDECKKWQNIFKDENY
ncbi:NLR family CARD domain-containing protein 4 [Holothuria leucospilota]|uniref:NLR family CARD domain-containing protein 4 n=1 Tax=Holothuria leucospilota TaxID=206669 RepID=A0A9Q1CSX0_HOLLE|nr:NLR family CARD domain-containing protein 4 [Holothuria leucospilota]